MQTKIILAFICLLVNISPIRAQEEIVVTIESLEDLAKYGFVCQEGDVEENQCVVKVAATAADLPAYFPESYRNLSGTNFIYVESRNESASGSFALVSSSLPVYSRTYVHFFMDYYTETPFTVGYMIYWADAGIGFFPAASNSEWKFDFAKMVTRASFEQNEVNYFLANDRKEKFSVFRKLEFKINPAPQINISITNLEEFASSGAVCPNCRLGAVASPQELPSYFPPGFHQLAPSPANESIMFINFQNTAFPELILADLSNSPNLSCTGYVHLAPEYYNERIGSFGWGKTYNTWSPYGTSEPGIWTVDDDGALFHLDYYLMQGNRLVGFHSYNDNFDKMSVFRKLVAKIYYYPQPTTDCRLVRESVSLEDTIFAGFAKLPAENYKGVKI